MSTPLETKLITAIAADSTLPGILGSRIYDTQLSQGTAFPALVIQSISSGKSYTYDGRNNLSRDRIQFTIWGGQFSAGAAAADTVLNALEAFLDTFSAVGNPSQFPNQISMERRGMFPQTDGPIFQRLVDVFIYNDNSI